MDLFSALFFDLTIFLEIRNIPNPVYPNGIIDKTSNRNPIASFIYQGFLSDADAKDFTGAKNFFDTFNGLTT